MENDAPQPLAPSQPIIGLNDGKKVLQPTSGNIEAASTPIAPAATHQVMTQSYENVVGNQSMGTRPLQNQSLQNISSVYPEATHGVSATNYQEPHPANDNDMVSSDAGNTNLIKVLVMIFGAIMIIVAAITFITWLKVARIPGFNKITNVLGLILAAGEFALGIGILMRREIARSTFIVVALIVFVFSLIGSYNYYRAIHDSSVSRKKEIVTTQQVVINYQNNTFIPASEKTQLIQKATQNEQQFLLELQKSKASIMPLIEAYVISLLPIIFLTRRSVKEIFI